MRAYSLRHRISSIHSPSLCRPAQMQFCAAGLSSATASGTGRNQHIEPLGTQPPRAVQHSHGLKCWWHTLHTACVPVVVERQSKWHHACPSNTRCLWVKLQGATVHKKRGLLNQHSSFMCSSCRVWSQLCFACTYLGMTALAAGLPQRVQVKEGSSRVPGLNQLPAFPVLVSMAQALERFLAPVGPGDGCLQLCLLNHLAVLNKLLWVCRTAERYGLRQGFQALAMNQAVASPTATHRHAASATKYCHASQHSASC